MSDDKSPSILSITLDEASIARGNPLVRQERETAINALLEDNYLTIIAPDVSHEAPYDLTLSVQETRMILTLTCRIERDHQFAIPLRAVSRTMKDYFDICDAHYRAVKEGHHGKIEAIDMGRRGLHDEGGSLIQRLLKNNIEMDFATARRLFTLICVLRSGTHGPRF